MWVHLPLALPLPDRLNTSSALKDATVTDGPNGTAFIDNTTFPVNIDTSFNVFNQTIPCSDGNDTVSVSFEAKADAQILLGFMVAGTLVPPSIAEVAVVASMSPEPETLFSLSDGINVFRHDRRYQWFLDCRCRNHSKRSPSPLRQTP